MNILHLYSNNLKSWIFGCAKAERLGLFKGPKRQKRAILFCSLFLISVFTPANAFSTSDASNLISPALKCDSLCGFQRFLVAPQYSLDNPTAREDVEEAIARQLSKIGTVIRLKIPDVTGLGNAEGILTLSINPTKTVQGKTTSFSIGTLSLFTSTMIEKTQKKCQNSEIWRCQAFFDNKTQKNNNEFLLAVVSSLIAEFETQYLKENKDPKSKPIFYLYQ